MGILKEKFETIAPPAKPSSHEWVSDASVRRPYRPPAFSADGEGVRGGFNALPPGTDIEAQERARIPVAPRVMDGETDVTDTFTREGIENGFVRRQVSPYSDAVSNEHWSPFYREAEGDDGVGFLERNNMLDRQ